MFRRPHQANVIDLRRPPKKSRRWPLAVAALIGIFILAGVVLVMYSAFATKTDSPIPKSVKKQVPFSVYYPASLPAGFVLNANSFNASSVAVVYSVTYHQNLKLVFTVQRKISDDDLAVFYKNQMPINRKVDTTVGQATVGAINGISAASLPTADAWVIVTDPKPPYVTRDQFDKVLQGMKKG